MYIMKKYDVLVVGGGPGGYPAAIRASQNGAKVAIIERDRFGGECTNYGCIPTKALLKGAKIASDLAKYPFVVGDTEIDYRELVKWVRKVSNRSSRGIEYLLKGYGVDIYKGEAIFKDIRNVTVNGEELYGDKIILAMGSKPVDIPGFAVDGEYIHNNRSILDISELPNSIAIIGAGYIGVEYATIFSELGVDVYLIELLDRVLPLMDKDFSMLMDRLLKKRDVKIYTSVKAEEWVGNGESVMVKLSNGVKLEVDIVLIAVGRKPNSRDLDKLGVKLDNEGFVIVDEMNKTSIDGVYAVGDLAGKPMLAHKAFLEGVIAGENASGGEMYRVSKYIPSVVYTEPELVSVGFTYDEAKEAGYDVKEVIYPIGGLAKAYIEGVSEGFVKLIVDGEGLIYGIHMAAPNASELAGEATYLLETRASLEDLSLTVHPHPTVSEALREAAEYSLGKPYHYLLK